MKKGRESNVIDLQSCLEAERGYELVAAGKPNHKSIDVDPELKNSPPSHLSQPSRSKSNKGKIFVAGDSIVRDVKEWLLPREKYVKVYSFSGAVTEDMSDVIKPSISKKPDEIIIHCGTNDLCCIKSPEKIVDNILKLRLVIVSYGIRCTVSNIVKHEDGYQDKAAMVNRLLFEEIPADQLIDNGGLASRHLNSSRLHLNTAGAARLASNFRNHIRKQSL